MKRLDENTLAPEDFTNAFADEPLSPDPAADLRRGRRSRLRHSAAAGLAAAGSLAVAVAVAIQVAGPIGATSVAGHPTGGPSSATGGPSTGAASPSVPATGTDAAPPLHYTKDGALLDANGRTLDEMRDPIFVATRRNAWTLTRAHLDPRHAHLEKFETDAFTGGGGGDAAEIGQKVGWPSPGQSGEAMLLVSITRIAPGGKPVLSGDDAMGLCSGTFTDEVACKSTTIGGHKVRYAESGGAFVMDLLQTDGEIASIYVDPVFGNNTDIPVENLGITPAEAADLLADPALDVLG